MAWVSEKSAVSGLSLIFVPRVTLGNAENYRMQFYNLPILLSFLFTEKYLLFLQKSCAFSRSKNRSSTLFFRGISLFFVEQKPTSNQWFTWNEVLTLGKNTLFLLALLARKSRRGLLSRR